MVHVRSAKRPDDATSMARSERSVTSKTQAAKSELSRFDFVLLVHPGRSIADDFREQNDAESGRKFSRSPISSFQHNRPESRRSHPATSQLRDLSDFAITSRLLPLCDVPHRRLHS